MSAVIFTRRTPSASDSMSSDTALLVCPAASNIYGALMQKMVLPCSSLSSMFCSSTCSAVSSPMLYCATNSFCAPLFLSTMFSLRFTESRIYSISTFGNTSAYTKPSVTASGVM